LVHCPVEHVSSLLQVMQRLPFKPQAEILGLVTHNPWLLQQPPQVELEQVAGLSLLPQPGSIKSPASAMQIRQPFIISLHQGDKPALNN
jgi:hypothetical protein